MVENLFNRLRRPFLKTRKRFTQTITLLCILCTVAFGDGDVQKEQSFFRRAGGAVGEFFGRFPQTVYETIRSPLVWAPAGGALAVWATRTDHAASNWASTNTPVYGSRENASRASDIFRDASRIAHASTIALNLMFARDYQDLSIPLRQAAAGLSAVSATGLATDFGKTNAGRKRPNGHDTRSFPSGHTSIAAVNYTLAAENLNQLDIPVPQRRILQSSLALGTFATGWARVEGEHHYLTDVLVGASLGNLMGTLLSRQFLPRMPENEITFHVVPSKKEIGFGFSVGL